MLIIKYKKYLTKLNEEKCAIPYENLGLDKDQMPQIPGELLTYFITFIKDQNVDAFKTRVKTSEITPTQGQLEWDKVESLMQNGFEKLSHGVPVIISNQNELCDGHHRWYALKQIDKNADMVCWQIDLNAKTIIQQMKQFQSMLERGEL